LHLSCNVCHTFVSFANLKARKILSCKGDEVGNWGYYVTRDVVIYSMGSEFKVMQLG
jgi:hypothetical protein